MREVDAGMSTRRFAVLLAGLSQTSVWRTAARDDLITIDDPEQAERELARALGG